MQNQVAPIFGFAPRLVLYLTLLHLYPIPLPYTLQGKHALEEDPCSCSHLGNICEANKELLKARNAGEGVGV